MKGDYGYGGWGPDPGYGMMKGAEYGKGYGMMKGGEYGKGPYGNFGCGGGGYGYDDGYGGGGCGGGCCGGCGGGCGYGDGYGGGCGGGGYDGGGYGAGGCGADWQQQAAMDSWGGKGKGCDYGMGQGEGYGARVKGDWGKGKNCARGEDILPSGCAAKGEGKSGKGGPKGACFTCGGFGHRQSDCPKGDQAGPGFGKDGAPKGPEKGKAHGKSKGRREEDKLFVGSLPKDISAERISEHFAEFGSVLSVDMKVDRDGSSRGFCIITFEDTESATKVLRRPIAENKLDGQWIDCKPCIAEEKGKGKGDKGKVSFDEIRDCPVSEKLFINNVPPEASEDALTFHFCQFGSVKDVSVKRDPFTGASRGFAFVVFESVDDAQLVLDTPDAFEFEGSTLDIKPAVEEKGGKGKGKGKGKDKDGNATKIWVGCIPLTANEDSVRTYFEYFGPVSDVNLEYDDMGLSRGFAHVNFQTEEPAKKVLDHYSDSHFDPLEWESGILLDIKAAEATKKEDRADIPVSEKLFVGSIPRHVTQEQLKESYSKYGPIKEIIMKCDPDGAPRGFCFLTFKDIESARKVLADGGNTLGACRPYAAEAKTPSSSNPPPMGNVLKVQGLPADPKSRDVFRFFFNFSVTRIRDTGDDIFIEFTSIEECKKAFSDKSGSKLGAHFVNMCGATQEELKEAGEQMKERDQNRGSKGDGRSRPY